MYTALKNIGQYFMLLRRVFSVPEKRAIFSKQIILEIEKIGLNSLGIVIIISLFVGAVVTIQTAFNLSNPFLPKYLIGLATRDSLILEFSPTMICLILAGKVGSNVASEIGSMRVTEQIDALEMMGVNSANFLILPKIIAAMFFFPFLVIISMGIGMFGGWLGSISVDVTTADFLYGLKHEFNPFYITYSLTKTVVFAFIITSVSSYYGYFTKGGALEVGVSSTKAVVYSSVVVLIFNFILTQLLLA
ncbi:MAG TPA: ABC transporter permease [Flavobacteriales bacterium]|jgi:phospholipid/cholesterol/gamma-HCH transport system permease protein|nr:ABC transporter permease [Flavobacteriales bacterium]HIL66800.1 ABC transporter permease [Flavobacteriales bacterium]|tara:strand:+ start:928 stop:1668 length:741 start_codon:yes stop_codon:yes gene_type:complete